MSAFHASPPRELSLAYVPVVESPEALSQSHAVTAACRSDSVPSSGQKVHCVLLCYGSAAMYVHGEGLSVWHVGMWGMLGLSRGGAQNGTITRSFVGHLS